MRAVIETGHTIDIPQSQQGPRLIELPSPDLSNAANLSVEPKYYEHVVDHLRAADIRNSLLEQLERFADSSAIVVDLKDIHILRTGRIGGDAADILSGDFLEGVESWARKKGTNPIPVVYRAFYSSNLIMLAHALREVKRYAFGVFSLEGERRVIPMGWVNTDIQ